MLDIPLDQPRKRLRWERAGRDLYRSKTAGARDDEECWEERED